MAIVKYKGLFFPVLFILLISLYFFSRNVVLDSYANTYTYFEAEDGKTNGSVTIKIDNSASGGKYAVLSDTLSLPFQPTAPYHAAFYYAWYKAPTVSGENYSYWSDGHSPPQNWFSNYMPIPPGAFNPTTKSLNPQTGLYSARDKNNFYWQINEMKNAHIEVGISSWWGRSISAISDAPGQFASEGKSDYAFRKIITDFMNQSNNPYPNLRWTLYYEKEGFSTPSVAEITADLTYINTEYAKQPAYLRINTMPVIFVYGEDTNSASGCDTVNRWFDATSQVRQATGTDFYVVLKVFPNFKTCPNQPESWHQYAPASFHVGSHEPYSSFVSPGFWKNGDTVRLARDTTENLTMFKTAVSTMVNANATWKLIQTWNEWGEGTSVEPGVPINQQTGTAQATYNINGVPFERKYVEALGSILPQLESNSTLTPTITLTPPTPTITGDNPVTIAAVGDMAQGTTNTCGTSNCKTKEVSDLILSWNPNKFLALGDVQYEQGEMADFMKFYEPTYGRLKTITIPAVGNHEYLDPAANNVPTAISYWDYFGRTGNTATAPGAPSQGYYATTIGAWKVFVLNTNCSKVTGGCTATSPQITWFKNELAATTNKCQMMIAHHPYISSDSRPFDTNELQPFWQAFYDAKGEVVLTGHSHYYERFKSLNPQKQVDPIQGIRQFIVGTGGKNVYVPADPVSNCTLKGAQVECTSETWGKAFGALKMRLYRSHYEWEFVQIPNDPNGLYSDSGSGVCQ